MAAEILSALVRAAIVASIAVMLVGLLRRPFRAKCGARAACWLWVLVPVLTLITVVPARTQVLIATHIELPRQIQAALAAVQVSAVAPNRFAVVILAMWVIGTCGMLLFLWHRQRLFVRSLGALQAQASGWHHCEGAHEPLLVGVRRPKIVVPADFEARYPAHERELILAHERAHLARRDVLSNLCASGWLCLFWFNPLMYFAIGWLRMDQELACDAQVVGARRELRRSYATALLRTQVASESGWQISAGCHWQSQHPLKERIVMLHRPMPKASRYFLGISLVAALTLCGGYGVWASQALANGTGTNVLVDLRLKITEALKDKGTAIRELQTQYLVHAGESVPGLLTARPDGLECVPFLPGQNAAAFAARGIPVPATGQILLDCKVMRDGTLVTSASVISSDGQPAVIEITDRTGVRHYRIEVSAFTSPETIATKVAAAKR